MKTITLLLCLFSIQANSQANSRIKKTNKTILKLNRYSVTKSSQITYTVVINKKTNKRDTLIAYKDLLLIDDKQNR
jgi:hypothetical protein